MIKFSSYRPSFAPEDKKVMEVDGISLLQVAHIKLSWQSAKKIKFLCKLYGKDKSGGGGTTIYNKNKGHCTMP